jgi:hypothetical protein
VLQSEPKTCRSQVSDYDEFINTQVCVPSLDAEALMNLASNILSIVDTITLYERVIKLTIAPLLRDDFGNISNAD